MADLRVVRLQCLDLRFGQRAWPFAVERRAQIDAHFERIRQDRPEIWNGRVLLAYESAIEGATLRGTFLETDFASFVSWRDWGFPDATVTNCFAMGALRSSDEAFLLGVMGAHTANSGDVYFPAGTPDPSDVQGSAVDLEGSVWREIAEETGLSSADLVAEPGWYAVPAGAYLALIKIVRAREPAIALRARILEHLRREAAPELSDIRIARDAADIDPRMPSFVTAFLRYCWTQE